MFKNLNGRIINLKKLNNKAPFTQQMRNISSPKFLSRIIGNFSKNRAEIVFGLLCLLVSSFIFLEFKNLNTHFFTIDLWRNAELEATRIWNLQHFMLGMKETGPGAPPTNSFSWRGLSPAGSNDDPFLFFLVGLCSWLGLNFNSQTVLGFLQTALYAVIIIFASLSVFVFKQRQKNVLVLPKIFVVLSIISVISLLQHTAPFSNFAAIQQTPPGMSRVSLVSTKDPFIYVDGFYGFQATVVSAFFFIWVFLVFYKEQKKLKAFFVIFGLISFIILESSRIGSFLFILPLVLITVGIKKIQLKGILLLTSSYFVGKILLSYGVNIIRSILSGMPLDLLPLNGNVGHRLLLGLSYNTEGLQAPGINGWLWNDAFVESRVISLHPGLVPYSNEYNSTTLEMFFGEVLSFPIDYLLQLCSKVFFTVQIMSWQLLVIFVLVCFLLLRKRKIFPSKKWKLFWCYLLIVSILPLLLSRPLTLFTYSMKPALDLFICYLMFTVLNLKLFAPPGVGLKTKNILYK
jgi:hypothetical protein